MASKEAGRAAIKRAAELVNSGNPFLARATAQSKVRALPHGWHAVDPTGDPVAGFAARCVHDNVDVVIRGTTRGAVCAAAEAYERGQRARMSDDATHADELPVALSEHDAAFWRIIPKRTADDCYRRRFATREDAEALMQGQRHRYKVAAFNRHGKLIA